MQLENFEQLEHVVSEADLILVGLGEEWVLTEELILEDLAEKNIVLHEMLLTARKEEKYNKLIPLLVAYYYNSYIPEVLEGAYANMLEMLEGKNYFIVSLTVDSYLAKMGFKEDRYVNPCGSYEKLQCDNCCNTQLITSEQLLKEVERIIVSVEGLDLTGQMLQQVLERCLTSIEERHCDQCGATMSFNLLDTKKYCEEGYLEKWQIYMKWLQGTLNKRLCVIEAGVGMKLPSVIRWPFEKTVFYNQKANMFRIHDKFYQINEEVAERAYSCKGHSVQVFKEKNVEAYS